MPIPELVGTSGPIASRPSAPLLGYEPYFWWATDAVTVPGGQTLYVTALEAGVLVWKTIGGSGGAPINSLGKYFVNVSGQIPVCPYTSVQAAITGAVADGHGVANPAVIWVLPGTYTESVAMVPGISVQGMVSDYDSSTASTSVLPNIAGTVSFASAATGASSLANLRVTGAVTVSGAGTLSIVFDNVEVVTIAAGTSALAVSTTTATMALRDSSFTAGTGQATASLVLISVAMAGFDALNCRFNCVDDTGVAFEIIGNGTYTLRQCNIFGRLFATTGVISTTRTEIGTTGVLATFVTGGRLFMHGGRITTNPSALTSGTGTLRTTDIEMPASATGAISTGTTSTPYYMLRQRTEIAFEGAGPFTVTALADLYTIDTLTNNVVVNLPALNTVPRGMPLRFKKIVNVLGTVTLTPNGADKIDGAATLVLAAGTFTGVELVTSVNALTNWFAVSNYG